MDVPVQDMCCRPAGVLQCQNDSDWVRVPSLDPGTSYSGFRMHCAVLPDGRVVLKKRTVMCVLDPSLRHVQQRVTDVVLGFCMTPVVTPEGVCYLAMGGAYDGFLSSLRFWRVARQGLVDLQQVLIPVVPPMTEGWVRTLCEIPGGRLAVSMVARSAHTYQRSWRVELWDVRTTTCVASLPCSTVTPHRLLGLTDSGVVCVARTSVFSHATSYMQVWRPPAVLSTPLCMKASVPPTTLQAVLPPHTDRLPLQTNWTTTNITVTRYVRTPAVWACALEPKYTHNIDLVNGLQLLPNGMAITTSTLEENCVRLWVGPFSAQVAAVAAWRRRAPAVLAHDTFHTLKLKWGK